MPKKKELRCPKCGSSDNLSRIEGLLAYAHVVPDEKEGWEYAGGSDIDWNTQNRYLARDEPEFYCHRCDTQFDLEEKHAKKDIAEEKHAKKAKPVRTPRRAKKRD